jgi:hypothetical protein
MTIDIAMLASAVGAVVTIVSGIVFLTRPLYKIFKQIEKDIGDIQGKLGGIERWTYRQQEDIDNSLAERKIIFNAVYALVEWAIQAGGNGQCHEAKRQMDEFIRELAHRGKSGK